MKATDQERQTILIVEDEKPIRKLVSIILKNAGYRVLEAANPTEASTIWNEQSTSIDLLLSDLSMPGISGQALARNLLSRQPTLRVLLTSGKPMAVESNVTCLAGTSRFLQKPYTQKQLLEAVEAALR